MKIGVYIPLTKGKYAIVDREHYDKVIEHSWQFHSQGYAANTNIGELLHQFIIFMEVDFYIGIIDHINGDKLDCRRENLRLTNKSVNMQTSKKRKGTSSKYKGVCYIKRVDKWLVYINANGSRSYLGTYSSETEAALAYNSEVVNLYGDLARLNEVSI